MQDQGEGGETPSSDPEVVRGRQQVIALIVSLGGSFLLITMVAGVPFLSVFGPLVVVGLLGMQIFRGTVWARWLLAAVTLLFAASNAWAAYLAASAGHSSWVLNAALTAIYLWCGFVLGLSRAIGAFQAMQRARALARRAGPSRPDDPQP